eukprot:scaffold31341_cov19-Tisochrysis_lutea.AAC.5
MPRFIAMLHSFAMCMKCSGTSLQRNLQKMLRCLIAHFIAMPHSIPKCINSSDASTRFIVSLCCNRHEMQRSCTLQ